MDVPPGITRNVTGAKIISIKPSPNKNNYMNTEIEKIIETLAWVFLAVAFIIVFISFRKPKQ